MACSDPSRGRGARWFVAAGTAAVALVLIGLLPAFPALAVASAAVQQAPIVGAASGRCVEVPGSSTGSGIQVQL